LICRWQKRNEDVTVILHAVFERLVMLHEERQPVFSVHPRHGFEGVGGIKQEVQDLLLARAQLDTVPGVVGQR
jgi:hypothetical protein